MPDLVMQAQHILPFDDGLKYTLFGRAFVSGDTNGFEWQADIDWTDAPLTINGKITNAAIAAAALAGHVILPADKKQIIGGAVL